MNSEAATEEAFLEGLLLTIDDLTFPQVTSTCSNPHIIEKFNMFIIFISIYDLGLQMVCQTGTESD